MIVISVLLLKMYCHKITDNSIQPSFNYNEKEQWQWHRIQMLHQSSKTNLSELKPGKLTPDPLLDSQNAIQFLHVLQKTERSDSTERIKWGTTTVSSVTQIENTHVIRGWLHNQFWQHHRMIWLQEVGYLRTEASSSLRQRLCSSWNYKYVCASFFAFTR